MKTTESVQSAGHTESADTPPSAYRTRSRFDVIVTRRKRSEAAAGLVGIDRERRLNVDTNSTSTSTEHSKSSEDKVEEAEQHVIRQLTQRLNRIQDQMCRDNPES